MAAQISLFNISDYGKIIRKRIRYKNPSYIKSYQFRVFNEETGAYQYYGDERHILRYKTLHKLYSIIYSYCGIPLFDVFERKEKDGIIIWGEERMAEIKDTWSMPLGDRVKLHIKLLRYLRKGFSIEESVCKIKN